MIAAVHVAVVVAAGPAAAQVVSDRADAVAVTIYREGDAPRVSNFADVTFFARGGLALITETRTVDLPAGRYRLTFRGVADGAVPETAALEGLPGETVERNYDFDLLSPGALLDRSVGERVRVVRTNRASGAVEEQDAVVRSGPRGVVLETVDGVEALDCSGSTERLVFDRVPDGLTDRATLSAVVDVLKPGRQTVRLSYIAMNFNWSADYVARLSADGRTLDLTGWITLANGGSTTFVDAPTQVVAGKVARDSSTRSPEANLIGVAPQCWPAATTTYGRGRTRERREEGPVVRQDFTEISPAEDIVVTGSRIRRLAEVSDLGDYKLYTLPEPTTVAARQSKQVRFLEQAKVPVKRIYSAKVGIGELSRDDRDGSVGPDIRGATVLLRMRNEAGAGLGRPLPGGTVAVMEATGGRPVLAGEAKLKDIAVGLPVELEIARAIDVTVSPKLVSERRLMRAGRSYVRYEVEVELTNAKPVPVDLEVAHEPEGESGLRVVSESGRHVMKDGAPLWPVRLQPGGRQAVRYTLEVDG
nr:hypothetical protein [Caulobacter sp. 17J80-11]